LLAPGARADEWNKLTYLTFSGPIQLPGVANAPAGTYTFRLADASTSRRVVQVLDKNTGKVYAMFLTMADHRMTPTDKPVVMFSESPAGTPPAVKAWFYPGETDGYEFVYPKDQATKIAQQTHQPVLTTADASSTSGSDAERISSLGGAKLGRVDENGQYSSIDNDNDRGASTAAGGNAPSAGSNASNTAASNPVSTTSNTAGNRSNTASTSSNSARSNTANSTSSQSARAQTNSARRSVASSRANNGRANSSTAVGTTGQSGQSSDTQTTSPNGNARQLPRTASPLGLMALLSALSLLAAVSVRRLRRLIAARV